ncbi:MAG: winged helix DNA-binding domain-containing protein [Actinomycetes bacterium]
MPRAAEDRLPPLVAQRLAAQQLSGPPATTPGQVVRRLLAVQAQDPRGARLAVRTRSQGVLAADIDSALTTRRSLLVTWLNRGTLHLVAAEDYWWLHPLTTPQLLTGNARRLRQEGVSPAQADRGVDTVLDAVTKEGPQTRAQLRTRLDAAGVPTGGQALVHVLVAASVRGHVVRGPMRHGEQAFVAVRDWLGEPPEPLARDDALARLARRYLVGHGPADARDLAKWAGIPLGEARRGLDGIADEVTQRGDGLVDLADRDRSARHPGAGHPPPRLLGPFDPLLLGWASRELIVGEHRQVVTTNGLFRPAALVGGRVVATWSLAGGTVSIHPLEAVSADVLGALERDAVDVLRFLGLPEQTPVTVSAAP